MDKTAIEINALKKEVLELQKKKLQLEIGLLQKENNTPPMMEIIKAADKLGYKISQARDGAWYAEKILGRNVANEATYLESGYDFQTLLPLFIELAKSQKRA